MKIESSETNPVFNITHNGLKLNILFSFLVFVLLSSSQTVYAQKKIIIPQSIQIQILKAEDERRYDDKLEKLLSDNNAGIRKRAALAAGRIGDEKAIAPLTSLLEKDKDLEVRAMAAFAIGEIESAKGADALVNALVNGETAKIRANAVEGIGKIVAALPQTEKEKAQTIGKSIVDVLEREKISKCPEDSVILKGLTAALRARPANAGATIAKFLNHSNDFIRESATNALARLRAKDGIEDVRKLLTNDKDPIIRANAARILAAAEDKESIDALLDRATKDADQRVRVSAIRALAGLGQRDFKIGTPLVERGESLLKNGNAQNELLEIATTLGRVLRYTQDEKAVKFLRNLRVAMDYSAPEVEIAFARVSPNAYVEDKMFSYLINETTVFTSTHQQSPRGEFDSNMLDWMRGTSIAQGLGELVNVTQKDEQEPQVKKDAKKYLSEILCEGKFKGPCLINISSVPDTLRAYAAFKPEGLDSVLRKLLKTTLTPQKPISETSKVKVDEGLISSANFNHVSYDVIVRATAADLLGDLPPSEENTKALIEALPIAFKDELDDALMSILGALGKQKNDKANEAIKTALKSDNHLVRRRAAQILKTNSVGDFSSEVGNVQTKNTTADYKRALARKNGSVKAVVETEKGNFTINFLPEDAPLTVDNFVMLAKKGYYKNILFHRVVPNFVIQGGDPRGDGNGGPGYSIRCEVNEAEYTRGAVGMALSGKDTGGSQWFVTHSPQPHLDGGYTVFGYVDEKDMKTVDSIARGNRIINVRIIEKRR